MKESNFNKIATSHPIDRVAARVTSKGTRWDSSAKKIQTEDSDDPIPMITNRKHRRYSAVKPNLTGRKQGRLTVLGLARDILTKRLNKSSMNKSAKWVCRCDCGTYTVRRAKSLQNPNNGEDACEWCRQMQYLARKQKYEEKQNRELDK